SSARRNFMLLFDLSNSSPVALARAQESARSFVAKSVQPRDLVGIGTIDAEHGFRLLTAFTTDRELVASAISNPSGFKSNDPLQLSNDTKIVTLSTDTGPEAVGGGDRAAAKADRGAAIADESRERMQQIQKANT